MAISVESIEDQDSFEGMREQWNALLKTSPADCFFLTWEWLSTWRRYLAGGRRLFILAVRSKGELIGLAPLVRRPAPVGLLRPFQTLEFLGSGTIGSDYLDLVIPGGREGEVIDALAEYLSRQRLMLRLTQLRRGTALALSLARALREREGWSLFEGATAVCPYIDLSGHTWLSYLGTLGSSHRYNFHRRLKQLNKECEVRFEQALTEEQRRQALALLVQLHHRRWEGRGCSQAFATSDLLAFHEELSRLALQRGWLRLFVLWSDGKPAAALYGFRYGRAFYFFQSGFDPGYARHSVGLVTMGLAIKGALEEGAEEYDLLHGDESYKFLWARKAREITQVELYPPSVAGLLYREVSGLGRIGRRVARRVLPRVMADRIAAARRMAVVRGYYVAESR